LLTIQSANFLALASTLVLVIVIAHLPETLASSRSLETDLAEGITNGSE
jgi:hypothetical protein